MVINAWWLFAAASGGALAGLGLAALLVASGRGTSFDDELQAIRRSPNGRLGLAQRACGRLNDAERLARALLLFYGGHTWTDWDCDLWEALTGTPEATTKTLCDLARQVEARAEAS